MNTIRRSLRALAGLWLVSALPAAGQSASLSVDKLATTNPAVAGQNLGYQITVSSEGPDDALNVQLSEPLPAGTTFVSLSAPAGWSCATPAVGASGTVTCTKATFVPGSEILLLTVAIAPSTPRGILTNVVTVSSTTADPDANDNVSSLDTTLVAPAFVTATKVGPTSAPPGAPITYTIVLSNAGPGLQDGTGDEFTDVLPPALTLVSASATSGTAVATIGTNTVTWDGQIPAGGSVTITIQATLGAAAIPGTTVLNQGSLATDVVGDGSNAGPGLTDDPRIPGQAPDPTPLGVATVSSIPTLGEWGLIALAALLAAAGSRRLSA